MKPLMKLFDKFRQLFKSANQSLISLESNIVNIPDHKDDLERLLADNPSFHTLDGVQTNYSPHPDTLRFLHGLLKPGSITLETGCGQTTVVFTMRSTNHTCITLDQNEAFLVDQYCLNLGYNHRVTFLTGSSDTILPYNNQIPNVLDLVFIDGAHGFPFPIIDWYYTAGKLKIGGNLCVDDYMIPSVKILFDFLCNEEEWKLISIVQNTAFFKKISSLRDLADWSWQKMNKNFQ